MKNILIKKLINNYLLITRSFHPGIDAKVRNMRFLLLAECVHQMRYFLGK